MKYLSHHCILAYILAFLSLSSLTFASEIGGGGFGDSGGSEVGGEESSCIEGASCGELSTCGGGTCVEGRCQCSTGVCGDGGKGGSEKCDDGNIIAGDGCDGSCEFDCKINTAPALGSWPSHANVEFCTNKPESAGKTSYARETNNECPTTEGCYYIYRCDPGYEWDTDTNSCEQKQIDIIKSPLTIVGSVGTYTIFASWQGGTSASISDVLTPKHGETITNITVTSRNGVIGGSPTRGGTNGSVNGITITNPSLGGSMTLTVTIDMPHGGDAEICNKATTTMGALSASSQDACLKGYNLSIKKTVKSDYDSGKGSSINSYPGARLGGGKIFDGDRVVYEIEIANDSPQDAWSPTITDIMPAGLVFVKFLEGNFTGPGSYPTVDTAGFPTVITMDGKFKVGAKYKMSFLARFDNDLGGYAIGQNMCNIARVDGYTPLHEESPSNNLTGACLEVTCGEEECEAEIYATNMQENRVIAGNGGSYTVRGQCQTEGTCNISDIFATNTVTLTYGVCDGTYTQNAGVYTITTTINSVPYAGNGNSIANALNTLINAGYAKGKTAALQIDSKGPGTFSYPCRRGNPNLTCEKTTCGPTLNQVRVIGGSAWTDLADVTKPAEGSQGAGAGVINQFTCSNCPVSTSCGDAIVDDGETCDDGNTIDTDACSNDCTTSTPENPVCGNAITESGEQCDDGNSIDTDSCKNNCSLGTTQSSCGDAIVQGTEQCDDGNTVNDDACTNTCTIPYCGDGVLNNGTAFRSGGLVSGASLLSTGYIHYQYDTELGLTSSDTNDMLGAAGAKVLFFDELNRRLRLGAGLSGDDTAGTDAGAVIMRAVDEGGAYIPGTRKQLDTELGVVTGDMLGEDGISYLFYDIPTKRHRLAAGARGVGNNKGAIFVWSVDSLGNMVANSVKQLDSELGATDNDRLGGSIYTLPGGINGGLLLAGMPGDSTAATGAGAIVGWQLTSTGTVISGSVDQYDTELGLTINSRLGIDGAKFLFYDNGGNAWFTAVSVEDGNAATNDGFVVVRSVDGNYDIIPSSVKQYSGTVLGLSAGNGFTEIENTNAGGPNTLPWIVALSPYNDSAGNNAGRVSMRQFDLQGNIVAGSLKHYDTQLGFTTSNAPSSLDVLFMEDIAGAPYQYLAVGLPHDNSAAGAVLIFAVDVSNAVTLLTSSIQKFADTTRVDAGDRFGEGGVTFWNKWGNGSVAERRLIAGAAQDDTAASDAGTVHLRKIPYWYEQLMDETCDDGNSNNNDTCRNDCTINPNGGAACVSYPLTYTSQPATGTANGCLSGTYADTTDTMFRFTWSCSDGTTTVACQAAKGTGQVCMSYTGTYTTQPATGTANACINGMYVDTGDTTTQFQWLCNFKGSDFLCAANKAVANPCKLYTGSYTSQPATGSASGCSSGSMTYVDTGDSSTQFLRTCLDPAGNTITPTLCSANKELYNVYTCKSDGTWQLTSPNGCNSLYYDLNNAYQANTEVCTTTQPSNTTCVVCGDTEVDTTEQCDDGNAVNTDNCSNSCKTPYCGDGILTNYQVSTGNNYYCRSQGVAAGGSILGLCNAGSLLGTSCTVNTKTGSCVGVCAIGGAQGQDTYCTNLPGETCVDVNDPCYGVATTGTIADEECDLGSVCVGGQRNGLACHNQPIGFCVNGLCQKKESPSCINCQEECGSPVMYPPGSVPGRSCPVGRWLFGCPGSYTCRRELIEPIMCLDTICGDGKIEGLEQCDEGKYCDDGTPCTADRAVCPGLEDECKPRASAFCNTNCSTPSCGDGFVNTQLSGSLIRNWNASGAVQTRSLLQTGAVIAKNQGGFTYLLSGGNALEGDKLGASMRLLKDINNDGREDVLIGLPGRDAGGEKNHGQILSLMFDVVGKVVAIREYFKGPYLASGGQIGSHIATIGDRDSILFSGTAQSHDDIFFFRKNATAWDVTGHALIIGKYDQYMASGVNLSVAVATPDFQIESMVTLGDSDNNGSTDVTVLNGKNPTTKEIVTLTTRKFLTDPVIGNANYSFSLAGGISYADIAAIGDTNNDGKEDILVGYGNTVGSKQFILERHFLDSIGGFISKQQLFSVGGKDYSNFALDYGKDVDGDGIQDIVYLATNSATNSIEGEVVLLKSDRTVKGRFAYTLFSPVTADTQTVKIAFFPDFDADGNQTVAFGAPKANNYEGAIYTYEILPPYAHYYTGAIEECDEGKRCISSTSIDCTNNPSVCPGGPSDCAVIEVNGCTIDCQGGCGNGILDAGEECDDKNTNNNDACSNECKTTYCGDGIINNNLANASGQTEDCDGGSNCTSSCVISGAVINGLCNYTSLVASGYNISYTGLQALLAADPYPQNFFCLYGVQVLSLTGSTDPISGMPIWSWTCKGQGSGAVNSTCSMQAWKCGDGVVDAWLGANGKPKEACDDGNLTNGDGCSSSCAFESLYIPSVDQILSGKAYCADVQYPQIEVGEYLPIRWRGDSKILVSTANFTSCDTSNAGKIAKNSLQGVFDIYNGASTARVATAAVSFLDTSGSSVMIQNARSDYAGKTDILGQSLVNKSVVSNRAGVGTSAIYGQYAMRLQQFTFNYCAVARSSNNGTVTGSIQGTPIEVCSNNFNDDFDSSEDCGDTDCANATTCLNSIGGQNNDLENTFLLCSDGINNDNDTNVDCADDDCQSLPHCKPEVKAEDCKTAIDEDGDGLPSCGDPHCTDTPYCRNYSGSPTNLEAQNCSDGVNNDGDDFTDCNDPDCILTYAGCNVNTPSLCTNTSNDEPVCIGNSCNADDQDSFQGEFINDAKDPQCFLHKNGLVAYTPEANCADGLTDNNMPNIDCSDPLCQFFSAACKAGPNGGLYLQRTVAYANAENCSTIVDDDNDGWANCSDVDCKNFTPCRTAVPVPITVPESQAPNGCSNMSGTSPIDDDLDGFANCADGDCKNAPSCKTNAAQPPAPQPPAAGAVQWLTHEDNKTYTQPLASGAICEGKFALSKGYFLQQGVSFSEQANTGLDTTTFVNINGDQLLSDATPLANDSVPVVTYAEEGRDYLFNTLSAKYQKRATAQAYQGSSNGVLYNFKKVPNTHIYYWNGNGTLIRNNAIRDQVMAQAMGITANAYNSLPEKPAYTIVVPNNAMTVEGSVDGNAMYVVAGNIRFEAVNCDEGDVVEGVFITKGAFSTTPVKNNLSTAARRCKGGNLHIKGVLFGDNAGSDLATQRRSTLNAWQESTMLFANTGSLVYQAKDLFEMCYLQNLTLNKLSKVDANIVPATTDRRPLEGCTITTLNSSSRPTVVAAAKARYTVVLGDYLFQKVMKNALTNPDATYNDDRAYIFSMMDSVPNISNMLVPNSIQFTIGTAGSRTIGSAANPINTSAFVTQMLTAGKLFPAWWFGSGNYTPGNMITSTIVLPDGTTTTISQGGTVVINLDIPANRIAFFNDLAKPIQSIKDGFLSFKKPIKNKGSGTSPYQIDVSATGGSILGDVNSMFQDLQYLNNLTPLAGYCLSPVGGKTQGYGNVLLSTVATCKYTFYPDFMWFVDKKALVVNESSARDAALYDGSAVVVSSTPSLWTKLPPAIKDFLDLLIVAPN